MPFQTKKCPKCRTYNATDYDKCYHCGTDLTIIQEETATSPTEKLESFIKKLIPTPLDAIYILGCVVFISLIITTAISRGNNSSTKLETIDPEEESSFSMDDSVQKPVSTARIEFDEYELADFNKFNSPASENGLGGSKIYLEGKITAIENLSGAIYARFEDIKQNNWLIILPDTSPNASLAHEFLNQNVRVFSTYEGFSTVEQLPAVSISADNDHIVCIDESNFATWIDFGLPALKSDIQKAISDKTTSHKHKSLTIKIPSNWEYKDSTDNAEHFYANDYEYLFTFSENASTNTDWNTFFEFRSATTIAYYKTPMERSTYVTNSNLEFQLAQFDFIHKNSTILATQRVIFAATQHENHNYVIAMNVVPSLDSNYSDTFYEVLESASFETTAKEPQEEAKNTPKPIEFDWDLCISTTKAQLTDPEFFPYVRGLNYEVDTDSKTITMTAILSASTADYIALDFADTMIRRLNSSAQVQNSNIKGATKDYYGGIYDEYTILIGIAPMGASTSDPSDWYVYDVITRGMHTRQRPTLQ
ncbi:MAG: zinc ribbon domain-containing protein [Clostridia bacterium]|nr:zinc ribbon domain-containing protein [Clostridia bacterium]